MRKYLIILLYNLVYSNKLEFDIKIIKEELEY
jgi:hypothetical protein